MSISIGFTTADIFKLKIGSMVAVVAKSDPQNQAALNVPEFVVFQGRVTPMFEIEQVGSGFPCKDEAKAKEIYQLIVSKNSPVPHIVMFNWDGGFWIATIKNQEAWYDELVLFHYHKPQKIGDQLSLFSLRHFKHCLGKPPEMIKEEMLPITDEAEAQKLLQQRSDELKAEDAAKKNAVAPRPTKPIPLSPDLKESQLLVLAKAFPETVKFLQANAIPNPIEAFAAYQRDIFKTTKIMDEPLTFNADQFDETVKALTNSRRRKKMGIDPIEYELVVGWVFRGYGEMTPLKRVEALKLRGLHPPSPEAVRKICRRLKLPQIRKPGFH